MALRQKKPITPGTRGMTVSTFEELDKTEPVKGLLKKLKNHAGRNSRGKITVRHRGGRCKRKYRIVDFKRDKDKIKAKVISIQYDPNRSSDIALIEYEDGEKRYIIAPLHLKVGDFVISGEESDVVVGNSMKILNIPVGTMIYNIELYPGRGGQIARSAGSTSQLMAKEGKYAQVRLPSGEVRMISSECCATIGQVGNVDHGNIKLGKAGRKRHMGIRPSVRGVVMNPNDHPHGGGEGKSPIGKPGPVTPWGKPTLGYKTRRKKKASSRYIIKGRKRRND